MMEPQKHTLKPEQVVRLKDGYDDFYDWARVGAQAIVKEVKFEGEGYPMALIEWDKNHWTYEGEDDGWYFQSHFKIVKEPMSKEIDPEFLAKIAAAVLAMEDDKPEEPAEQIPEVEIDRVAEYAKAVKYAIKELEDTEGFLLVAVNKIEGEDGASILAPSVVSYAMSTTGVLAIHTQLAVLSANNYQVLLEEKLVEAAAAEDDDES